MISFTHKTTLFIVLLLLSVVLPITINTALASPSPETKAAILQAADKTKNGNYVATRFLEQVKQPFDTADSRKTMLVMGDSHAQDFYNALLENGVDQRYQIRTRRIPGICGLYFGAENIAPLVQKKHVATCRNADTLKAALPQIKQADVVIIAANWPLWAAQRVPTTVKNLTITAPQKLLVVGRKDLGKVNIRKYLRMTDDELRALRNPVLGEQHEINRVMRDGLPKAVFIDIQRLICGDGTDCPLFTPEVRLISFDGGHLTKAGARYVGKKVVNNVKALTSH